MTHSSSTDAHGIAISSPSSLLARSPCVATPPSNLLDESSHQPSAGLCPSPLPTELKREILRFCDQDTFATTSRVSLQFLELSSPLLYQNVNIRGRKGLERLFCVSPERQESLSTYLDVHQIKSLDFIMTELDNEFAGQSVPRLLLWEDRLRPGSLDSPPFFVKTVLSSIDNVVLHVINYPIPPHQTDAILVGSPSVLALLNPARFEVQIVSDKRIELDMDRDSVSSWTRLREFRTSSPFYTSASYLPNLEGPSVKPFIVTLDLVGQNLGHNYAYLFDYTDGAFGGAAPILEYPSVVGLVLRVAAEEQAQSLRHRIQTYWEEPLEGITGEERRRWAGMIEFEEADTGTRRPFAMQD